MNKKLLVLVLSIVAVAASSALAGSRNPVVGGQEMYPTKDIIDNAVNSADHTTLVTAVKAAGWMTMSGSIVTIEASTASRLATSSASRVAAITSSGAPRSRCSARRSSSWTTSIPTWPPAPVTRTRI